MSEQQERVDPDLVEALHKKVNELEDRVDELESQLDDGGASSTGVGSRDQAVMAQLDVGDVVGVGDIKQLYRIQTDIRNNKTLKKRIKSLKKRPEFVRVGHMQWRYTGGED